MRALLCMLLWAISAAAGAATDSSGSPGTATPQPYSPTVLPALPANPQKPPLLRMPGVQSNKPQPSLPQLKVSPDRDERQPGKAPDPRKIRER